MSTGNFFAKIGFLPLLAAILNFCVKRKSAFGNDVRKSRLDPQVICRMYWRHFAKSLSCHFLVAILNFCVKRKTHLSWEQDFGCHLKFWWKLKMSFISKTLRDKVISSNVWTLWVLETLDIVPVKKLEFPEFCRPS